MDFPVIYDDNNFIVANEIEVTDDYSPEMSIEERTQKRSEGIKIAAFFEPNDYFNGALFEEKNYCWSQTISEIEITVRLPNALVTEQLAVKITPTFLQIAPKSSKEIVLEGTLHEKVKSADATWCIVESGKLIVVIDKLKELWWSRLLTNELPIDIEQIDRSRPYEELSEGQQFEIEKITWDERQKIAGCPTSDQIAREEILKKAWDVEGSPFKGSEYDPSSVKFEN